MRSRLIIDGNAVYEVDEDCRQKKRKDKHLYQNIPDTKTVPGIEISGMPKSCQ